MAGGLAPCETDGAVGIRKTKKVYLARLFAVVTDTLSRVT